MLNKSIYFVLFLKVFAICAGEDARLIDFQEARDQFMLEIARTCHGPTFKEIVAERDFVGALAMSLDQKKVKQCSVLQEAIFCTTLFEQCIAGGYFTANSMSDLSGSQKIDMFRKGVIFCNDSYGSISEQIFIIDKLK